ncbi:MAG TPA: Glu-tRNA(Gln) amidotransferase subunit GatE [bacterium]|nr:Glu-tRNA(Gln) amidotransferase subunit GatE [Myxococcales bacterium]OQA62176.1 MAG: Aspartyl/glutamyl-tRNA(Asn/Gln) amidotransferase subunit B [bacterium ADurb.Bin270]HPW45733.1 Glu-tRNA(Gln) amidotransferase subunit GatE [bacterium]HQC50322.1 Glu-tRNA(Gln) amidotransferase subunit GatE [bacterium]HQG12943.1 Glu-tRNA(Gln) amidotransferase subunit GatE [bacterium]
MTEGLKKLGFMCGVEVHQQLLTQKKLFCRCPAGLYSDRHHAEVLRHMRPTLSEMGVYDACALMEFKTKKEIIYLLNKNSVCTYDMDDTPPFPINREALDIAIEIALLVGCSIVDEIHIVRKQYLDGSIPTGFQRTAIIGINGSIPFEGKNIGVRQISIEEDSCREVQDTGHQIKFRTDRLGMPLIEVVTEPCFETPEEAGRAVKHIGRLLRATGKVRRGIGSVRQDVNVSIKGGSRVEIKGVPRYQLIPALTATEAMRQKALLEIRDELRRRKITAENLETWESDLTEDLKSTCSPHLKQAIESGHRIRGIRLNRLAGILNHPTQPGRMFSSELSGRVRVIACLDGIPNIYHTDNYPEYQRSHIDRRVIRLALNLKEEDVGIIAWGPEADTITATTEIKNRILDAIEGVPHETRQHMREGLTDFERILPGADRMYPDTDHPPIRITPEHVAKIKEDLPEATYEVETRLASYGIPTDSIEFLALSDKVALIDHLHKAGKNMKLVGRILGQAARSLQRQGIDLSAMKNTRWTELIEQCHSKKIQAKHFENLIINAAAYPERTIAELADDLVAVKAEV